MSIQATLKSLPTNTLLALYNALTKKSTTKFASRENGEKQTFGAAKVAGEEEVNRILASLGHVPEEPKPAEPTTPATTAPTKPAKAPKTPKAPRAPKAPKPAPAPAKVVDGSCPKCQATEDQTPAGAENTIAGEERNFCHPCGTEYWRSSGKVYNRRKPGKDVKASMSASWKDPEVRAARSARHGVSVHEQGDAANTKADFKSVAEAFRQLRLPMSKHIKLRLEVKDSGSAKFEHGKKTFVFKLIEKKD